MRSSNFLPGDRYGAQLANTMSSWRSGTGLSSISISCISSETRQLRGDSRCWFQHERAGQTIAYFPTAADIASFKSSSLRVLLISPTIKESLEMERRRIINFETTIDWFEMESFRKLRSIFMLCLLVCTVAILCEAMLREKRRRCVRAGEEILRLSQKAPFLSVRILLGIIQPIVHIVCHLVRAASHSVRRIFRYIFDQVYSVAI